LTYRSQRAGDSADLKRTTAGLCGRLSEGGAAQGGECREQAGWVSAIAQAEGAASAFDNFAAAVVQQAQRNTDAGRGITLRDALAAASTTVNAARFPDNPRKEAEYHYLIGNAVYNKFTLPKVAESHLRRTSEMMERVDPTNDEVLDRMRNMPEYSRRPVSPPRHKVTALKVLIQFLDAAPERGQDIEEP
jgi:hypothetical protein